jgi:hypothetical protein
MKTPVLVSQGNLDKRQGKLRLGKVMSEDGYNRSVNRKRENCLPCGPGPPCYGEDTSASRRRPGRNTCSGLYP